MKIDERHSGPMILGSIIKDPPSHRESRHFLSTWGARVYHSGGTAQEMHESVRYPQPKSSKLIFDY